jgi:hypothetical protein
MIAAALVYYPGESSRGATILRPGAERSENKERRTEVASETPRLRDAEGPALCCRFFALRSFSAAMRMPFRESVLAAALKWGGSGALPRSRTTHHFAVVNVQLFVQFFPPTLALTVTV